MTLLIAILSTWKLTVMLAQYEGSLNTVKRIRVFVEKLQGEYKIINFDCFFCLSIWVALPLAFLLGDGWMILPYWFAISGGASIIDEALTTL